MGETFKKELINYDKKRIKIRKEYKEELRSKEPVIDKENYIFFPKTLISENNYQLRFGISWVENGFIIKLGENVIAIDPGVNFVFRLTESNFDLSSITHLFISHAHLDHSADANFLMDFMIRCNKEVKIIAPKSVFDEKVISDFHSGLKVKFPVKHKPIIVNFDSNIDLLSGYKMKFILLNHSVECLGFKIFNNNSSYTYLSDTSYSTELINKENKRIHINDLNELMEEYSSYSANTAIKEFVKNSNILIANVDSFTYTKNSKTHLPLLDLIEILKDNNIGKVLLAHINPLGELKSEEWSNKLGDYVFLTTGIETLTIKKEINKFNI